MAGDLHLSVTRTCCLDRIEYLKKTIYFLYIICYGHYWPLYSGLCVLEVRVQNLGGQGYVTVDVTDLQ